MLLSAWRSSAWLFLLPALLPVLNFSPWTGWWLLDETDLLVLALAAGAYARWACTRHEATRDVRGVPWWLWLLLLASLVGGVWRGLLDAGMDPVALGGWLRDSRLWQEGLYAGYDSAWNTLRVAKSLAWGLLLVPLLRAPAAQQGPGPVPLLARGMVSGLALVGLVVLWERLVYAGLFEFNLPYRTTAWFWEMHVGGGAIDAYLAMATPFAFWAMWSARAPWRWLGANLLMWVTVYVVLTTYSRGVYLAVVLALVFMAAVAWVCRIPPAAGRAWGRRDLAAVLAAVAFQSALVLGGGTYMFDRLAASNVDLIGRVAHWLAGISLVNHGEDLALGLGVGRLPAHYSQETPDGELSGSARWSGLQQGKAHVVLSGPATRGELVGLFSLTQRVRLEDTGPYVVRLRAQVDLPVSLVVSLCERHLLYSYQCQWEYVDLEPGEDDALNGIEASLQGDAFGERGPWQRLRGGVLAITPTEAGSVVRLESVELINAQGRQVLSNTRFIQGMAHWFPMARGHFLPWHMDNLYLELLIERGLIGLAVLGLWLAWAATRLWAGLRHADPSAWVLGGALFGMLSLGAVISVTELPRLALMLVLLLFATSSIRTRIG